MNTMPTINRMVHYVSYGSKDGRYESKCRAAVVTETHDDEMVGLCVLNPTGLFFDRECRHDETDHTGGSWHWPCVTNPTKEA